jgi:hypothetical protein
VRDALPKPFSDLLRAGSDEKMILVACRSPKNPPVSSNLQYRFEKAIARGCLRGGASAG